MKCHNCGKEIKGTDASWREDYRDAMIAIHAQECLPPTTISYERQREMFNEFKALIEEHKRQREQQKRL